MASWAVVGAFTPFFILLLGVPAETILSIKVFAAFLCAGLVAGGLNATFTTLVLGRRMNILASLDRRLGDLAANTPPAPHDSDLIGQERSDQPEHAVRAFNKMLTAHLELEGLTLQAVRSLIRFTRASGGAFLVEVEGELTVISSISVERPERLAHSELVRDAILTGNLQRLELPPEVLLDGLSSSYRPLELVALPVSFKNVPLGVVVLGSTKRFDDELLGRLEVFSQGLALALNNALFRDSIARQSTIDLSTGVYSRRFGLRRLREEYSRAVRGEAPLGLLMLEIDDLDVISDRFGGAVGDRVLTGICRTSKRNLREGDVLIRYRGDRFLVLLPAAGSEDLKVISERLRRALSELSVVHGEGTLKVTVTIGGASYPVHRVESEEDLVRLAAEALSLAKAGGPSRLVTSVRQLTADPRGELRES